MVSPPSRPTRDRRQRGPSPYKSAAQRRRRAAALAVVAVLVGTIAALLAFHSGKAGDGTRQLGGASAKDRDPMALLPGSAEGDGVDPLRYTDSVRQDREGRAAAGLAHVLYAKSPGGAVATAARVARLRPLVERAAKAGDVDPNVLEGMVFLESAGRTSVIANPSDLSSATGLTQILAETATNLLGLKVDVAASARLTRGIARGRKVADRARLRRKVDERFDPAKALAATVRYLNIARDKFKASSDRDALAVASYHMGIGNLQTALSRFGDDKASYAELYFASSPVDHADAFTFLRGLGDDSSTYLWRVRAAEAIMARYRADPAGLTTLAALQTNKASSEEVLHPLGSTPEYATAAELKAAEADGTLRPLDAAQLRRYGVRIDPSMGELAKGLGQRASTYRALRPEALATLLYLGAAAQGISGQAPLVLTSTVRDDAYQKLLTARNIEATKRYSLHTTGFTFDIARKYADGDQAQAFQFALDRLTALNVIAWVREPAAIHITVGPLGRQLLPLLRAGAPRPQPVAAATTTAATGR